VWWKLLGKKATLLSWVCPAAAEMVRFFTAASVFQAAIASYAHNHFFFFMGLEEKQ